MRLRTADSRAVAQRSGSGAVDQAHCRSGSRCERSDGHTREHPRTQGGVARPQFQIRWNLPTASSGEVMKPNAEANMSPLKRFWAQIRRFAKALEGIDDP